MPETPKNILYIRPDTFGDLVLFAPAVAHLIAAWPDATHTLLVRPGYESIAPLFPGQLQWKVSPLNPFLESPTKCRAVLETLRAELEQSPPDLIVAARLDRTWLEAALAAHFPQARRVAIGHSELDQLFATTVKRKDGATTTNVFSEIVEVDPDALEWENNLCLVDHLLGRKVERQPPALLVPKAATRQADEILKQKGLKENQWVACFPAGVANVSIKAWPPAQFAKTVVWLQQQQSLPVMLLGHQNEAAILEEVAAEVVRLGQPRPAFWLGKDGEITLLAALLQTAQFFFGNDTGPMHLAAGVGRPVVAIFGGGHWPRFKPVGRQVVAVVQPLPCFGCKWECYFADAPCVKTLGAADVQSAILRLLAAGDTPLDLVIETKNLSPEALGLITAAAPLYRKSQRDRIDRQHKIEELTHLGREKDVEIAALKKETDLKDGEIGYLKKEADTKDTEIAGLKSETDLKDGEIAELKTETDSKDAEIDGLKSETDLKDGEIASLKNEANTKDDEITQLKATCNEREILIFKLTDIVKDLQKQIADLTVTSQHREQHIVQLTAGNEELGKVAAEHEQLKLHLAALPPDAAQYGQWLHDKDVHIQNIERLAAEQRHSLENLAASYRDLEQIKRYARWLHEKEIVIQQLKRACDQRESVIQQLIGEAAGLKRISQVFRATREYFRQRLWSPLREKSFHWLVEGHWMQIGVLRQYEPRPILWDAGLPKKGRLPDARLPAMVIVTPSLNQAKFLESTLLSVLNQEYPSLRFGVQDGASTDGSVEIIQRYSSRLASWTSEKDHGQGDAICRGFQKLGGTPDDIMAWLNSDDLIAPRALRLVAEYFVRHPEVDVVYGHRIIIDDHDLEIGRWIMPRHDPETLEWIDYVPQETLFFRRRIWDAVGGIDPSFQFALDWDLLARFQLAKAKVVRLPFFLGCFRLHSEQKTSQHIHTRGHEEMTRIRTRIHGPVIDSAQIDRHARKARLGGAISSRCLALGIRI